MALRLNQKQEIVAEVNREAGEALAAVLADYRGMTVSEMTSVREQARDSGVYLKVVRNTLAKRAVAGTEYECLNDALVGPTLLAFSRGEPNSAARLLKDCTREYQALKVKALSIGGELLDASQLDVVARLPTREQAIALLMAVMQAPIAKLARTLNEVPGKLARTLAAIRDAKESGS